MDRLNIGIVGLNFGRHIVADVASGGAAQYFRLAAVCDLDRAKADALAAATGAKAVYAFDDLLRDSDVRVIGLFTGPNQRAALLRKILQAGKDCMTTKPLESDPGEALKVLREARSMGRIIHLNSPGPLPSPDLACIAEWRAAYRLGRPVAAHAETWASYRETADGSWYDDPGRCPAAPLTRLGIYLINDLIALFGTPTQVQVQTSRLFTGRPTADNAHMGLAFGNGALATVHASFCTNDGDHYRTALTVHFENGTIYRNVGPDRSSAAGDMSLIMAVDGKRKCVERRTVDALSGQYQWEALYRAVNGERLAHEATPEQLVAGLYVMEAVRKAEADGGVADIRIPVVS